HGTDGSPDDRARSSRYDERDDALSGHHVGCPGDPMDDECDSETANDRDNHSRGEDTDKVYQPPFSRPTIRAGRLGHGRQRPPRFEELDVFGAYAVCPLRYRFRRLVPGDAVANATGEAACGPSQSDERSGIHGLYDICRV